MCTRNRTIPFSMHSIYILRTNAQMHFDHDAIKSRRCVALCLFQCISPRWYPNAMDSLHVWCIQCTYRRLTSAPPAFASVVELQKKMKKRKRIISPFFSYSSISFWRSSTLSFSISFRLFVFGYLFICACIAFFSLFIHFAFLLFLLLHIEFLLRWQHRRHRTTRCREKDKRATVSRVELREWAQKAWSTIRCQWPATNDIVYSDRASESATFDYCLFLCNRWGEHKIQKEPERYTHTYVRSHNPTICRQQNFAISRCMRNRVLHVFTIWSRDLFAVNILASVAATIGNRQSKLNNGKKKTKTKSRLRTYSESECGKGQIVCK